MRISILADWTFIPTFMGNDKEPEKGQLRLTLHPLSGREELDASNKGGFSLGSMLDKIVVGMDNPPILVGKDGKERKATLDDIAGQPGLKGLYYEIIAEVGAKTNLAEAEALDLK